MKEIFVNIAVLLTIAIVFFGFVATIYGYISIVTMWFQGAKKRFARKHNDN